MTTTGRHGVGSRTAWISVGLLAAGAFGGWIARGVSGDDHTASVRIEEGWAYHGAAGGAFACCGDSQDKAGGPGYKIDGVLWRDLSKVEAPWRDGTSYPECLPETSSVRVRIGVVDVRSHAEAPGGPVVAWLECL